MCRVMMVVPPVGIDVLEDQMQGRKSKKPLTMVCIKLFRDEWDEFKDICGEGMASNRLRQLIAQDIAEHKETAESLLSARR